MISRCFQHGSMNVHVHDRSTMRDDARTDRSEAFYDANNLCKPDLQKTPRLSRLTGALSAPPASAPLLRHISRPHRNDKWNTRESAIPGTVGRVLKFHTGSSWIAIKCYKSELQ